MKQWLSEELGIKYPIIMAPMFLVSNVTMTKAALDAGITGCLPAQNYRKVEDFRAALDELNAHGGPYGVNLIANRSNIYLKAQLEVVIEKKPAFVITSLGNPKEIIDQCHKIGTKVFCDVVDKEFALKVESLGADAVIAVNSGAGGHAGLIPAQILVPMLKEACTIPVINAGGVASGTGLFSVLSLGADGVSIGTLFIATDECPVNIDYKNALVSYGAEDVVMSDKLSGTPCTVIKTPYVKKVGTKQNILESYLNKNKKLKKAVKAITFYRGMKSLEKAAFSSTYKSVWCAGPSIELIKEIKSVKDCVDSIVLEYQKLATVLAKKEVT